MGHSTTIDLDLVQALFDLVDYAVLRLSTSGDTGAAEYLEEQLSVIRSKLENERFGGGDLTCVQIDHLLKMLGEGDG